MSIRKNLFIPLLFLCLVTIEVQGQQDAQSRVVVGCGLVDREPCFQDLDDCLLRGALPDRPGDADDPCVAVGQFDSSEQAEIQGDESSNSSYACPLGIDDRVPHSANPGNGKEPGRPDPGL